MKLPGHTPHKTASLFHEPKTWLPISFITRHWGFRLFSRYLFWTDWSHQPFVARASMDGTGFTKIITTGIIWPNALTLDLYTDRVFVGDANMDRIT